MKLTHNKSGFTLLELIIVIIILGIVASLALPRFVRTAAGARAQEALTHLGVLRESMERCFVANVPNTYAGCTMATLDVEDPSFTAGLVPGSTFNYTMPAAGTPTTWSIVATSTVAGAGAGTVTMAVNTAAVLPTPVVVRSGTGAFSGVR